jgi:hypothetical protein
VGGIVFALVIAQAVTNPEFLEVLGDKFLNEQAIDAQMKEADSQVAATTAELNVDSILGKVLPFVTENPALAPLFETKQEVEEAAEAVLSLPEEQRNAVCSQICE